MKTKYVQYIFFAFSIYLFSNNLKAQKNYDRLFLAFEVRINNGNGWSNFYQNDAGVFFDGSYIYLVDKSERREVIKYEVIEIHDEQANDNVWLFSCIDDRGLGCVITWIDNIDHPKSWDIFIFRYGSGENIVRTQYNVIEKK